mmetsp:Transcript_17103/g.47733  ORF Transcript_17103/g.47733 Transcript_17103/m.47733 type:complete len:110 (-) Transcript_17103:768-1097(-)
MGTQYTVAVLSIDIDRLYVSFLGHILAIAVVSLSSWHLYYANQYSLSVSSLCPSSLLSSPLTGGRLHINDVGMACSERPAGVQESLLPSSSWGSSSQGRTVAVWMVGCK